jgi:hypothetical protein
VALVEAKAAELEAESQTSAAVTAAE